MKEPKAVRVERLIRFLNTPSCFHAPGGLARNGASGEWPCETCAQLLIDAARAPSPAPEEKL